MIGERVLMFLFLNTERPEMTSSWWKWNYPLASTALPQVCIVETSQYMTCALDINSAQCLELRQRRVRRAFRCKVSRMVCVQSRDDVCEGTAAECLQLPESEDSGDCVPRIRRLEAS